MYCIASYCNSRPISLLYDATYCNTCTTMINGFPLGVHAYTLILGISSVMAQFEQTVDQFRWPGWAVAFIMVVFSLLFQLVYRNVETEPKKPACKGVCLRGISRSSFKKHCSNASLKLLSCRNVVVSSI